MGEAPTSGTAGGLWKTTRAIRRNRPSDCDLWDGRQLSGDGGGGRAAGRMAPAGRADAHGEPGCGGNVIDDVVGSGRVRTYSAGNTVQLEGVSRAPGDIVVGAR